MNTEITKVCRKCKKPLPLNCFTKDKYKDSGLFFMCKDCRRIYRKELLQRRKLQSPPNPPQYKNLPQELKECMICHYALPRSEFGLKLKKRKNLRSEHLRSECKQCRSEKNKREWLNSNRRWNAIFKKFGVTREQHAKMFEEQNGKCAICGVPQIEMKKQFAIDHCHNTGKVRGLLCECCNHLLGQSQDNINILQSAIKYLERTNGPKLF